ncbi:hypothetical protein BD310DRAFT_924648 [Dichomitus squalens]|uniref:Secreted protein n=1 Tax=Dichomitus squalens TaxID=114155 RepID=A0A4Q9PYG6_9APHY|nr:hypothetical protein BD310DRAFT_924648 [Dichomitus squalens]
MLASHSIHIGPLLIFVTQAADAPLLTGCAAGRFSRLSTLSSVWARRCPWNGCTCDTLSRPKTTATSPFPRMLSPQWPEKSPLPGIRAFQA